MMSFAMALPWHEGEQKMHALMRVPEQDNPSAPALSAQASQMLQRGPLLALGTVDSDGRPWATIWGGQPPLSQPLGQSLVGIKCPVEPKYDPVVQSLFGEDRSGEVVPAQGEGRMVGGLSMDLETRKRVKLYGRLAAGAVSGPSSSSESNDNEQEDRRGQVQMVVRVDQCLGNCPKYLNRKRIRPGPCTPTLLDSSDSATLCDAAVQLIGRSDLFFVSSSNHALDMDVNHRGGPAGFTRVHRLDSGAHEIVWPEYSGNRLYQTLGNFQVTPLAGLVFPDFETGDVLYVTGETQVVIGKDAAAVIPHSNLAVKVRITASRYVRTGLPFRGDPGEPSPYNPKVRPLADEKIAMAVVKEVSSQDNTATLQSREDITPTISRFRFKLSNTASWKAGAWVAMDFSEELDIGYSHMRDDDPLSINDDFLRTFTVSSSPPPSSEAPGSSVPDDQFEITIRRVGVATKLLGRQNPRAHFELPVKGFGGDFRVELDRDKELLTGYVVGGIGITPLLAQLPELDVKKLKVFWTIHQDDLALAVDVVEKHKDLSQSLMLYVTGTDDEPDETSKEKMDKLTTLGVKVEVRRLKEEDLQVPGFSDRWYMCVGTRLKASILQWLAGKEVITESFDY